MKSDTFIPLNGNEVNKGRQSLLKYMIKDIRNKEHHFYSLIYKHFKEVGKQVESQEDYNPVRDLKYDSYSASFYTKFIDYFKNLNQIDKPWSEGTF